MKKLLFASLVLAVSAASVSPAFAGFVYVPVLDRTGSSGSKHTTEVWVSNNGTEERRYATFFLPAGSGGIQRSGTSTKSTVLAGRTVKLIGIGGGGGGSATGLLEIEGGTQVLVEARMVNAPSGGFGAATAVPVISSENALAPNAIAELLALSRDTSGAYTDLEVVNLGNQAAQCAIQLFRADGSQIGSTAKVAVPPLALRHFGDVFTVLGETSVADARARVACNQTFFAFAGIFNPARTLLTFATPAASGASTLAGPNGPPPSAAIVFEQSGQVHKPVLGNETRQIAVPVPRPLSLKRVTIDWDVVPGPWTASKPDGNHNLIWVHRGKYRSNTLANVNTFGPPRSGIKNTQNLDMAARALTLQEVPLVLQEGVSYHFHYVYNAETNRVTLTVTSQGSTLATLDMEGSAANKLVTVPATGLIVQFGHTAAQAAGGIEFPTYGWVYSNLRIEMLP
jgi:hypothetical protein